VTKRVCCALLGFAAGIGVWLGPAYAANQQAFSSAPSGSAVVQSMLQESAKVRTVHASGVAQGPAGMLNLIGDCAGVLQPSRAGALLASLGVMSWVHGFLRHAAKTSTVNVHVISLQKGTEAPQAWSRSPSSGNRWRVAGRGAGVAEVYTSVVCLPFYARSTLTVPHTSWNNLGTQTVNGRTAWQVQATYSTRNVAFSVTTLSIDTSTHDLLRYDYTQTTVRPHSVARTTMEYSGFNQKLSIVAPKVGATSP
jgi:hypothetical protein